MSVFDFVIRYVQTMATDAGSYWTNRDFADEIAEGPFDRELRSVESWELARIPTVWARQETERSSHEVRDSKVPSQL